jgi:hypothetical protein
MRNDDRKTYEVEYINMLGRRTFVMVQAKDEDEAKLVVPSYARWSAKAVEQVVGGQR